LAVRAWYKRFGLESEKIYQEPDDHIGLEMVFLSHLAGLGARALTEQDRDRFEELLNAQHEFMEEHLGAWVLPWCSQVKQHAKTDFYMGLAYLIRGAIVTLAEELDVELANEVTE
jgi:TorA maturation chaperone TorD